MSSSCKPVRTLIYFQLFSYFETAKMKKLQINLLRCETNSTGNHKDFLHHAPFLDSARGVLITGMILLFFILAATGVFSYYASGNDDSYVSRAWDTVSSITRFANLNHFASGFTKKLQGEENRINLLVLGVGGEGHEGPQLADSIMLVSIDGKSSQIALFSIPRDLVIQLERYGFRKINNANAFGEQDSAGWGGEFTRKALEKTFDIPIHYYVRIDFAGFAKIVDTLDGITVTVDKSFTDYKYPTLNKKYQSVSFQAGEQVMDGDTALKFVRSRHSPMNQEGSDFARSRRQKKVLLSFKNKLTSPDVLLNPGKISELLALVQNNITTNMAAWEFARFFSFLKNRDFSSIISVSFDDSPEGFLRSSISSEGAYILEPRDGTFDEIREKIHSIFSLSPILLSGARDEKPVVSIKNGTLVEGLAMQVARGLVGAGFEIDFIGNASQKNISQTTIYDFTNGGKKKSLDALAARFANTAISNAPPQERAAIPKSDFLIMLGQDSTALINQ